MKKIKCSQCGRTMKYSCEGNVGGELPCSKFVCKCGWFTLLSIYCEGEIYSLKQLEEADNDD